MNANVNRRSDAYGGSIEGHNHFALEAARAVANTIGADRVGIRLSLHGVFNGIGSFPDEDAQFLALAGGLSALGLLYLHLLDHSAMGTPSVPAEMKSRMRRGFKGPFILAGGFDRASAESGLGEDRADLIAFGRPFLANPVLVERMKVSAPLNAPDMAAFYTPGPKGYMDYPPRAH